MYADRDRVSVCAAYLKTRILSSIHIRLEKIGSDQYITNRIQHTRYYQLCSREKFEHAGPHEQLLLVHYCKAYTPHKRTTD